MSPRPRYVSEPFGGGLAQSDSEIEGQVADVAQSAQFDQFGEYRRLVLVVGALDSCLKLRQGKMIDAVEIARTQREGGYPAR